MSGVLSRCSDIDDLRAALDQEASLIVLGCHGAPQAADGKLRLSVGGNNVAATDLLGTVTLKGATVLCAVCYAGTGPIFSRGGWESLVEMLLDAGARVVVGSRWPAWAEPQTVSAFRRLICELLANSTDPDVWQAGHALARFIGAVRSNNDPRQWLGWAAWIDGPPAA